jgi:peptide/nickel transport system permease protein
MIRFFVRRLLLIGPALLGLLILTFILVRVLPNDPSAALAGENATPQQIQQIRQQYGFDKPLIVQFWIYLGQVFRGDFGNSIYSGLPVAAEIAHRLPATIELTLAALLLSAGVGIPLGALAAVWHNSALDHALRIFTVAGLAIAAFWLAIMMQLLFAMELDILPLRARMDITSVAPPTVTGLLTVDSLLAGDLSAFQDAVAHLVLPAVTLAFGSLATITRFSRAGMLESLQKDFVTYETAAGYPRRRVIWVYVLRNSLVATVTQIGLLFGALISSAVAVESIFDWPGIGSYLVEAILTSDFKAVLAVTLMVGVIYAVVNILVDLVHALIDPRVAEQL